MTETADVLLRAIDMLQQIPKEPNNISTSDLLSRLQGLGYNITARTLQRDLNNISAKQPLACVVKGKTNCWYWPKDGRVLDLPCMDAATALAFELMHQHVNYLLPPQVTEQVTPYYQRGQEVLRLQTGKPHARWSDKIRVIGGGTSFLKPAWIEPAIHDNATKALFTGHIIQARYKARSRSQTKDYRLAPRGLVSMSGVLYLVCSDLGAADILKQFALHRFQAIEVTDERATHLDDDAFSRYVDDEHGMAFLNQPKPIRLRLLVQESTAEHLKERPLSDDQVVKQGAEGWVNLSASVMDTTELRWWLLAMGKYIQVQSPKPVRDFLVEHASTMLGYYTSPKQ